jgi:hypothetical protein
VIPKSATIYPLPVFSAILCKQKKLIRSIPERKLTTLTEPAASAALQHCQHRSDPLRLADHDTMFANLFALCS